MSNSLDMIESGARLAQRALNPGVGLGAAMERAPKTIFNKPVSGERCYAVGELPLADVKAVAKVARVTVNDVFMAVCGGAMRRYLKRRGELPAQTLIAGCPVSLQKDPTVADTNVLSAMKVSLGTHIADPMIRLKHINASANAAKGVTADTAGAVGGSFALPGLPLLMNAAARVNERLGLARFAEMPVNLIVSNVPGPRKTLYCNGAKMLAHYPVSIPAHGQAVNITVQSYVDGMYFAVTGCAKALPDAAQLRNDVLAAYADLCAAMPSSVVNIGSGAPKVESKPAQATTTANRKQRVA